AGNPRPDLRQRASEGGKPGELVRVALLGPLRMVSVLLSPARIASGRLQMAFRQGADPHRGVGRRDGQLADPLKRDGIVDPAAILVAVAKALAATYPPDARTGVVDVDKTLRTGFAHAGILARRSKHPACPRQVHGLLQRPLPPFSRRRPIMQSP